ncbi:MAG TPA: hypothetical protein VLS96_02565 [Nodosilinea sp.]|nr:hypothetical protein [Nodosilinea sp.]
MENSGSRALPAVVIGGSIAGLLTARVLSETFERVVIVERDRLPAAGVPRRGVPQSVQPHVLFVRGYRILEELFPGIGRDLTAAGAVAIDWGREFHYFHRGGFNAKVAGDSGLVSFTCTRPLLEMVVRRRVAQLPNVTWLEGARVCGLVGDPEQVRGLRYCPSPRAEQQQLATALVVDASGRSSHGPDWLAALGAPPPLTTVVTAFLGYATQRLRLPAGGPTDWKVLLIAQEPPHNRRLGYIAAVEGNEWIATLGGYSKDYPPLEPEGFLDFARSLAHPAFYELLKSAQPVSPIRAHRATANRLYHYEKLPLPAGFAALGDAVCALCPVYGQGMTVSALSALELRDWLRQQPQGQPLATAGFQRRLAKVLEFPWEVSTGADLQFPLTAGRAAASPVSDLFQRYIERVIQKSKQEGWVHAHFTEIVHMVKPPTAFFTPRLLLKALSW